MRPYKTNEMQGSCTFVTFFSSELAKNNQKNRVKIHTMKVN